MEPNKLNSDYWTKRYLNGETGWDQGKISTPIKNYIDQLTNKDISILIPGCGNGHEGIYLWDLDFKNTHFLDFSNLPIQRIKQTRPAIPNENLITGDFFELVETFDLIIEQTLFCAIHPSKRSDYAKQASRLLKPNGKIVGLFFDKTFEEGPPFGGSKDEYLQYFKPYFKEVKMESCYNSIDSRSGGELFAIIKKTAS